MKKSLLVLGLVLSLFPGLAEAQVKSMDGINLGEHWFGPKRTLEDLKGRVVMFELWGYN